MSNTIKFNALMVLMSAALLAAGCGDVQTLDGGPAGGASSSPSGGNGEPDAPAPGQLTAGEWDDLEHWAYWLDLIAADSEVDFERYASTWGIHTRSRYAVEATTPDGEPAVDTPVRLEDAEGQVLWRARTDNRGHAELYSRPFSDGEPVGRRVVAGVEGSMATIDNPIPTVDGERQELELMRVDLPPNSLDLMLVVDTTSSMSDELRYLQSELSDVVESIQDNEEKQLDMRLSVNFYRDSGDDYIVRSNPFTTDIQTAQDTLSNQAAVGGGDYPEAVHAGLDDAIENHEWSQSARARLLFLVLDAPPHESSQVRASLHASMRAAAEKGVRIIPVAASGTDRSTEYLMRTSSILTGGTYTFLTNDSGIGNDHLEPSIGEYEVEYLNDLMVRVIGEYTE